MSKTLRTAAIVVGAVALASTVVGAAIGAGVVAGTTATTAAGAGAFGTAGISFSATAAGSFAAAAGTLGAVASGLSFAAAVTAKRPSPSSGGSQTRFKADPLAGIPYAMGRTLVGGHIVYHEAHGKDNQFNSFAVVLSGAGPIESLDAFRVDGADVAFAGGAAVGGYAGWMWQATQLGQAPEAAALAVPAAVGSPAPGWTGAHRLSGMAAALWTLRFDRKQKIFAAGTPQPGWLGHWVRVYDPRLDDSWPGGAGSCRALDEASYVWSDNPYLHALTWLLGRWQNGVRILGIGAPPAMIDVAAFVEGANVAEANGWTLGGVVYSTDAKWNVLKMMLQAGGGEPLRLGARISCLINTPRVSLATVRAGDIVGDTAVPACAPRRSRLNGVVPLYRSEAHGWEMVAAAPVRVAAYVAEDGEPRTREIVYPLVQGVDQAAELALYDIVNAREFGPVELPLKPRWLGYKPGDCITVEAAELGLNGQTLLILERRLDPDGRVTMRARSETGAKHGFALGLTGTPPPTPGVTGDALNDVPAPAAGAWEVAGGVLGAGGVSVPVLAVAGACDNANADAIMFEYRVDGAGEWIAAGSEPPASVRKDIAAVTAGTPYLVAVSYRVRGVVGARRVLGPVVTGEYSGIEGPPGADGAPTYSWLAFANSADGSIDFTTTAPGARQYLGLAANKPSPVESTDPADYSWAKIQGPQGSAGVPGPPGPNGEPTYIWIAYANSAAGTADFTTGEPGARRYIGVAPNRLTPVESSDPADYSWAKIEGPTGPPGAPGATGAPGPVGPVGSTGPAGPPGPPGAFRSAVTAAMTGAVSAEILVGLASGESVAVDGFFNSAVDGACSCTLHIEASVDGGGWVTIGSGASTAAAVGEPAVLDVVATFSNGSGTSQRVALLGVAVAAGAGDFVGAPWGSFIRA